MARIQKLHITPGINGKNSSHYADRKLGFNTSTGNFEKASEAVLLDLTIRQLTQPAEQSYKPKTLLKDQDSKTYCIFIPTNQRFAKENWKVYKLKPKGSTREALALRRFLLLLLIATASGGHMKQDAGDRGSVTDRTTFSPMKPITRQARPTYPPAIK